MGEDSGASIKDVHINFGFFDPLPLSTFGTDFYYKIHATPLMCLLFCDHPPPSDANIISGCPSFGGESSGLEGEHQMPHFPWRPSASKRSLSSSSKNKATF